MAVISDLRSMTLGQAMDLFQEYAGLAKDCEKRTAASEVRIQTEKERTAEANRPDQDRMDEILGTLTEFIRAHAHDLFRRPRKQRTDFGSFGLDTATKVEVDDQDAVIRFAEEHPDLELTATTTSVLKTKLLAAIRDGRKVPGARLVQGDLVVVKVDKAYLQS